MDVYVNSKYSDTHDVAVTGNQGMTRNPKTLRIAEL